MSASKIKFIFYLLGICSICVPGSAQELHGPSDSVHIVLAPAPHVDQGGTEASSLEKDVRFLCDPSCYGRLSAGPGYTAAVLWTKMRMNECGLKTSIRHFSAEGKPRHNVLGTLETSPGAKWIIVLARLDGVGDRDAQRYPGADANASGVAGLLSLADTLRSDGGLAKNVLFAALDGHACGLAGAYELFRSLPSMGISTSKVALVVNLEEIGTSLAPPSKAWKNYLIALGGARYGKSLQQCNIGLELQLYYDYYGSTGFTDMFYRRISDHKPFLEAGLPCVMFTSGITMNTNRPTDGPETLNYPLLQRRLELIRRWIAKF